MTSTTKETRSFHGEASRREKGKIEKEREREKRERFEQQEER